MSELKVNEVSMVEVEKVKLDQTNPNILTPEQMQGVRESFRRFGYLDPIVIDQNDMIADGEHRLAIYKEFDRKEIPCYRLELTDVERRLLRQTKNKLHGSHEAEKDAQDLKILFNSNKLGDLSSLIAIDHFKLLKKIADQDVSFKELAKKQLPSIYELVVECSSQGEQERIYNKLIQEGFKVRILTL